jgi:hypothetical protein
LLLVGEESLSDIVSVTIENAIHPTVLPSVRGSDEDPARSREPTSVGAESFEDGSPDEAIERVQRATDLHGGSVLLDPRAEAVGVAVESALFPSGEASDEDRAIVLRVLEVRPLVRMRESESVAVSVCRDSGFPAKRALDLRRSEDGLFVRLVLVARLAIRETGLFVIEEFRAPSALVA